MKKIKPTLEINCSNRCCMGCHHMGVDISSDCFFCFLYYDKLVEQKGKEINLALRCDQCLADEVKEEA